MATPEIVAVGSIGIDTIETPKDRAENVLGGAASHFAVAASFYTQVGLIGVVGQDFPEDQRQILEGRGVDLEGLEVAEGRTFRWSGKYHENLNHRDTLEVQLNVYEDYSVKVPESYRSPRILFLANIGPDIQSEALKACASADFVALDTMELWIETQRPELLALLKKVDLFFLNEDEARHLTGKHSLVEAGRAILAMGPKRVVLKKGSHGAFLFSEDEVFVAPAFPEARLVDPTGAGDSFAGGFLGHLARAGWEDPAEFRKAVIHGSIMGSINVEGFSCHAFANIQSSTIEERYQRFREITRFD